jgi:hypothetical protein
MVWWVRHYGVGSRSSGGHDDDEGDDVPAFADDGDSDDYHLFGLARYLFVDFYTCYMILSVVWYTSV